MDTAFFSHENYLQVFLSTIFGAIPVLPFILYGILVLGICIKIILETETPPSRALAYLFLGCVNIKYGYNA